MHWYDKDGNLKEVDLREGRKQGYAPSVTEIIKEFDNSYGLDLYKQKQAIMAAMTLPRPEGITDDQFYNLIVEDSKAHSEQAKEFGVEFHYKISDLLKNPAKWPPRFNMELFMDRKVIEVYEWIQNNHDSVIIDFKTTSTKNGKFNSPYNSWLFQLCAYRDGFNFEYGKQYIEQSFSNNHYGGTIDFSFIHKDSSIKLINIMISSTEDIPIKVYEWKFEKIKWGIDVFTKMLNLYRTLKKL